MLWPVDLRKRRHRPLLGGGDTSPLGETGAETDVAFAEEDVAPVEVLADGDAELGVEAGSPATASEERLLGDVVSVVDGDSLARVAARCI